MKLNRKIIIPAATLLIGFAMAGSATSTIAWYQYSTKANVAYLGTSAGTSANLLVRIKGYNNDAENGGWGSFIGYDDVDNYLATLTAKKIKPITTGAMGTDVKLPQFYSNPIYGNGPLSLWKQADATNYVQIPLQFKFVERDGRLDNQNKEIESLVAKDLYLSDLLIQNDYSNATTAKRDLSSAIRVHFDGYLDGAQEGSHTYRLASKTGTDTMTVGNLDLNGDSNLDKSYDLTDAEEHAAMYSFGENYATKGTPIAYGSVPNQTDNNQKSYSASSILSQKLGTTSTEEGKFLNVLVTIWIEGWQQLPVASDTDDEKSSMWDLVKTVDSKFDVGMQFEAKDIE